MSEKKAQTKEPGRRRAALKITSAGLLAGGSLKALPNTWTKPVINSLVLPAHARTSDIDCVLPPIEPPIIIPPEPTLPPITTAPPGTTSPPGTTLPPVTTAPPVLPPTGGIFVCDANGRNCEFQAATQCGSLYYIGEIYSNDAVRIVLSGFPPNVPITIDTSSGNHSCNNCPSTTNSRGIANMLFSTGSKGDHLTIITVEDCVITVNWTAVNPGDVSKLRTGLPYC